METKNNNISFNGISQRLNHSNYNFWKKQTETVLQQKVLFHHIQYSSYNDYREATYIPSSIKEKKYFREKDKILKKIINLDNTNGAVYTPGNQEDELEALEDTFKDNF